MTGFAVHSWWNAMEHGYNSQLQKRLEICLAFSSLAGQAVGEGLATVGEDRMWHDAACSNCCKALHQLWWRARGCRC